MNQIVMLSAFRNTPPSGLDRYFRQASEYRDALRDRNYKLRLAVVEGDSDTQAVWQGIVHRAKKYDLECSLQDASHGGPVFGSVVSKERFDALSKMGNQLLGYVKDDDDIVVYVESDLIWHPQVLLHLGSQLLELNLDIVSPLIFAGENFYDVWGYRGLDGQMFGPFKPYHSSVGWSNSHNLGLTEVSSVGSCLVMKAHVARECRMIDNECLVGFCRDARNKGYRVWVDSRVKINHP